MISVLHTRLPRLTLSLFLFSCFFSFIFECDGLLTPSGRQPSLVFIISDDMRVGPVLAKNASIPHPISLPNLRRLMNTGIMFDNAMTNFPLCSPSRQSFLTGRTPDALKVWIQTDNFRERDSAPRSFPEQLIDNGYTTISIGNSAYAPD